MKGPDGRPINGCLAAGTLTEAYVADDNSTLLLGVAFATDLHLDFGAPAMAWMRCDSSLISG